MRRVQTSFADLCELYEDTVRRMRREHKSSNVDWEEVAAQHIIEQARLMPPADAKVMLDLLSSRDLAKLAGIERRIQRCAR